MVGIKDGPNIVTIIRYSQYYREGSTKVIIAVTGRHSP